MAPSQPEQQSCWGKQQFCNANVAYRGGRWRPGGNFPDGNIAEMVARADLGVYQAKNDGWDQIRLFACRDCHGATPADTDDRNDGSVRSVSVRRGEQIRSSGRVAKWLTEARRQHLAGRTRCSRCLPVQLPSRHKHKAQRNYRAAWSKSRCSSHRRFSVSLLELCRAGSWHGERIPGRLSSDYK
jgi:hypothetical protein